MTPVELNTVVLPANTTVKRHLRRSIPDARKTLYENGQLGAYDWYTLLYDIFLNADYTTITAVGPVPLNLEQQLLPAQIEVNGHKLPLIVHSHQKKLIILEAVSPVPLTGDTSAVISLANGQQQTIALQAPTPLDGLSLVTIQKNNKLQWIRDWISYYRNEFGIQHVYIYDNNSDRQETLIEALDNIATVIPWNFPHGLKHRSGNKFCQVGALNHFKHRFGQNTVIFNFDIDELLVCHNPQIKRAIRRGEMLHFDSYTVPFSATSTPDYSFRDFKYREKEPRNGSTKYVMKGDLPGFMNVHHFNPAAHFWHRLLPGSWRRAPLVPVTDAYFLHYRGITTNWKAHSRDRLKTVETAANFLIEDTAVIDAFSRFQP